MEFTKNTFSVESLNTLPWESNLKIIPVWAGQKKMSQIFTATLKTCVAAGELLRVIIFYNRCVKSPFLLGSLIQKILCTGHLFLPLPPKEKPWVKNPGLHPDPP